MSWLLRFGFQRRISYGFSHGFNANQRKGGLSSPASDAGKMLKAEAAATCEERAPSPCLLSGCSAADAAVAPGSECGERVKLKVHRAAARSGTCANAASFALLDLAVRLLGFT